MTREEFKAWTAGGPVLLDGATGSNLMKTGMPRGVCTELWVLEHPEIVLELQRNYREAGSQVILAPTFSANRVSLTDRGVGERLKEINERLLAITKEAAAGKAYVAGDMTTIGRADADYAMLLGIYREQAEALAEGGADLIMVETMLGLEETMAALEGCREACGLPVLCSLTIESDGSLFFGGNIFDAAEALAQMGADAVGVNCSTGPDKLEPVIRNIKERVDVPVLAKPNAGMPVITDTGEAVYSMGPDQFAAYMGTLVEAGAGIIGGCCGTTPEYIRKAAELCGRRN